MINVCQGSKYTYDFFTTAIYYEISLFLQSLLTTKCKKKMFTFYCVLLSLPIERYTNADLKISLCAGIHIKQYPENFALLILRILELFTREICIFSKERLIF